MANRKLLPYHEGDWFSIPLGNGGYALGLIARSNGKGDLFCHFFGPRRPSPPKFEETAGLAPANSLFHALCRDSGLVRKHWRFVGRAEVWERFDWPIPLLAERQGSGAHHAVQIADNLAKLSKTVVKVSDAELQTLQTAEVLNPSFIEGRLDKGLSRFHGSGF